MGMYICRWMMLGEEVLRSRERSNVKVLDIQFEKGEV